MSEAKDENKGEAKSPLSRWSERKLAVRRGDVVDDEAAQAHREPAPTPPEPAEPAAEPELPALPSIDELDFQSDYTAFLAKNVPEALRRAALRKLWTSDPVLANLDGLNDYDEDYNVVDQVITLAQSGYQPGRGYLDEAEKKLAQIDETFGGASDSPSVPVQTDSAADDDALSDNDAAVLKSADAARQSADAVPDPALPQPAKEPGK